MNTNLKHITIKELSEILKNKFSGNSYPSCTRRNKLPSPEWMIVGHHPITKAIKLAGLPTEKFWSGSSPTPSTQSPACIVIYARDIYFNYEKYLRKLKLEKILEI